MPRCSPVSRHGAQWSAPYLGRGLGTGEGKHLARRRWIQEPSSFTLTSIALRRPCCLARSRSDHLLLSSSRSDHLLLSSSLSWSDPFVSPISSSATITPGWREIQIRGKFFIRYSRINVRPLLHKTCTACFLVALAFFILF